MISGYEDTILSFYEYEYDKEPIVETLYDHINAGLKFAKKIKGSKLLKNFLSDIAERNNLSYSELIYWFKKAIDYSIVLHDIGKIYYQSSIVKKKDREYLVFTGHELLSALITRKLFFKYLKNIDVSDEKIDYFRSVFQFPVVFSILFHHHAMNISRRRKAIDNYLVIKDITPYLDNLRETLFFIDKDYRDDILNITYEIAKTKLPKVKLEINGLLKETWRYYINGGYGSKILLFLLSLLLTLDYKSCVKRGDSETKFKKVIERYYLILSQTI